MACGCVACVCGATCNCQAKLPSKVVSLKAIIRENAAAAKSSSSSHGVQKNQWLTALGGGSSTDSLNRIRKRVGLKSSLRLAQKVKAILQDAKVAVQSVSLLPDLCDSKLTAVEISLLHFEDSAGISNATFDSVKAVLEAKGISVHSQIMDDSEQNIQGQVELAVHCKSCINTLNETISSIPGIVNGTLNVNETNASFQFDPAVVTLTDIRKKVAAHGFNVQSSTSQIHTKQLLRKTVFGIEGLTCVSCVNGVINSLKSKPGVISVDVTLFPPRATVIYDANLSSESFLSERIEEVGFGVESAITNVVLSEGGPGDQIINVQDSETVAITFNVEGMTCATCVNSVERMLNQKAGVTEAQVNLLSHKAKILYYPDLIGPRDLLGAINDMGFEGTLLKELDPFASAKIRGVAELKQFRSLAIYAFIFAFPVALFSMILGMALPESNPARQFAMYEVIPGLTVSALVGLLCSTPCQFIVGYRFYRGSYKSLVYGRTANMDVLVALGTSAAYFFSLYSTLSTVITKSAPREEYFETSALLIFFVHLGKYLETYAKGKTGESVSKLLELQPESATLVTVDDAGNEISSREESVGLIQVGDIVKVPLGARFPCDAVIFKGETYINESMMTGEPVPILKGEGDKVFSGTLNSTSMVLVKVTRIGADSSLARIVKLVDDAQSSKAPIEATADAITRVFVPAVISLSFLTFVVWMIAAQLAPDIVPEGMTKVGFALEFAVAVVVIACPCSLALATPTAIMVGTGVGALQGVLMKGGGASLEASKNTRAILFDKTGTLTSGKPAVTAARWLSSSDWAIAVNLSSMAAIIKHMESSSTHPLAAAVSEYLGKEFNDPDNGTPQLSNMREVMGMGMSAEHSLESGGKCVIFVGSRRWVVESNFCKPETADGQQLESTASEWAATGCTAIYVGVEVIIGNSSSWHLIGVLRVADQLRPNAAAVVRAMTSMGIRVIMMTGDNERTAKAVAMDVGIAPENVFAGCLPEDKGKYVDQIKAEVKAKHPSYKVAFAGDGINDSVALAKADVGIAIGAGADIAIESASAVLLRSDPADILTLFALARAVINRVRLNLFWAFLYNVSAIPIAAGVFYRPFHVQLAPWIAGGAMALSSVTVVVSSLLLRTFKAPKLPS